MNSAPPPGWYPDPERAGSQRYWTGSEWGPAAPRKGGDEDLTFGALLGIALPVVGLLYGAWMLLRGNGNGGWVILLSVFAAIVWTFVLVFMVGLGSA